MSKSLKEALDALAGAREPVAPELDVRRILLDVVPGDGDGFEVYAKTVADVEAKLSDMGQRLEEFELRAAATPAPDAHARDAARYRWLRDVAATREDVTVPFVCGRRDLALFGDECDAAIDAAMQGEK